MKKSILTLIVLAAFGLGSTGCSKSPKDLCKKMFDIMKKESKSKKEEKKEVMDKMMKKCTDDLEGMKKKDAKAYKCYAGCVSDASKMADMDKCEKKCEPKKK